MNRTTHALGRALAAGLRTMPRLALVGGLLWALLATFPLASSPVGAAGPGAMVTGCATSSLPANDDGSSSAIPLGFTLDYFGVTYSNVYVNNNGNITLDGPYSSYSGLDLGTIRKPIVAPLFYDIDTRPAGSAKASWAQTTFGGRPAFCAQWNGVGTYNQNTANLSWFQVLVVDRGDRRAGDFDIVFNYDQVDTGRYVPAAGYAAADGTYYELPGSRVAGALADTDPTTGLIHRSYGSSQLGRYVFEVRDGRPPDDDDVVIPPAPAERVSQSIDFPALPDVPYGTAPFAPGATASSGLPVALGTSGPCTVVDGHIAVTDVGTCAVTARQDGDDDTLPAEPVTRSFQVVPAPATVTVGDRTVGYDGTARAVGVSTEPAGLEHAVTVTYDGSTTPPAEAGTYRVEARLDHPHHVASVATATLTIEQATQAIHFVPTGWLAFGDPPRELEASATSGLPVALTATGACQVTGTTLTLVGGGGCEVTATQGGDRNWAPAAPVTQAVTVARAAQDITFAPPGDLVFGAPARDLTAQASSGLPITWTAVGPCRVEDGALAASGAGTCEVTASQAGDTDWEPTAPATRTVTIDKATAVVGLSGLDQVADGTDRVVMVTTTPAGLGGVLVTYDGSPVAPRRVGTYVVQATLDHPDHRAEVVTGTLVVRPPVLPVAPVLTPVGGLPAHAPGVVRLSEGGVPQDVVVRSQATSLAIVGPSFSATLVATDAQGKPVPPTVDGVLQVTQGTTVQVTATGFVAGSEVATWVFSDPHLLGTTVVGGDGAIDALFPVPSDLPVGRHTLQVNGVTDHGETRSLSVGVVAVAPPGATPPAGAGNPPSPDPVEPVPAPEPVTAEAPPVAVPVDGKQAPEPEASADEPVESADESAEPAPGPVATTGAVATGAETASRSPAPTPPPASTGAARYPPYDPVEHIEEVVGLQVSTHALLALAGSGAAVGVASRAERRKSKVTGAKVKNVKGRWSGNAPGDASRTWRWPLVSTVDRLSASWPVRLAPVSPLLARTTTDGSYLRAMLGSASLVVPLTTVLVALLALFDTGGEAVPPANWLMIALIVLGFLDVAGGLAAALVFAVGVVVTGHAGDADAVRTLMGVGVMWFAPALIASAARPFRRPPAESASDRWQRVGDWVIAPLLGGWAAQKMVGALPGLSGHQLPFAELADEVGLLVLGLVLFRLAAESACSWLYPQRLAAVTPEKIPFSGPRQRLAAIGLRTAIFVFAAVAFVGNCWQLWVGAVLFAGPQVLSVYENSLPNLPGLYRVLPKKVVKVVVMMVVGTWFGTMVSGRIDDPERLLVDGFVIFTLPGLALSLLGLVGREGRERELGARDHAVGGAIVTAGVLMALGIVG